MTGQKLRVGVLKSQLCAVALAVTLYRVISADSEGAAVSGTVLGADERTGLGLKQFCPTVCSLLPALGAGGQESVHSDTQHLFLLTNDRPGKMSVSLQ